MEKYIFILGKNPKLSQAEILAVWPDFKILAVGDEYLVVTGQAIDSTTAIRQLGGTIKIGRVLANKPMAETARDFIASQKLGESKTNFGVSYYGGLATDNFGMILKRRLQDIGVKCRLVISRDPALSAVVVTKNKCYDFLILPGFFGITEAVQDFEDYSQRDYGRPASDSQSGMLPPKVAKMMINLAGINKNNLLLDPFCGSGTILTEAAVLGYKKLVGSDISGKAIADAEKNFNWVKDQYKLSVEANIFQCDVRKLGKELKARVDAIVTEPYLGPALRGRPTRDVAMKIIKEVEGILLSAFGQFNGIVKKGGRVVIVFPEWHLNGSPLKLKLDEAIKRTKFKALDKGDLYYKRADQKVWRNIRIWEKE